MTARCATLILFFAAVSHYCASQPYISEHGKFEVDQIMGCAPFSVNISALPPFTCNASNPCDVDLLRDGNFQVLSPPHTYQDPGVYWMRVQIQTHPMDSILITVVPNIPPEFDLYACGNNEISIDITDTNYDEYVVDIGDGTQIVGPAGAYQHLFATSGNKTVTVRGRNENAADNCSDNTKNIIAMPTIPAPSITRLEVLDDVSARLDFSGSPDILYRLEIAVNSNSSFQLYGTISNVTSEVVTNLRTEDNYYCFRLGAYDPCNNTTFYSPPFCTANFDLSVANNANNLTWATNTSGSTDLRLLRTETGGSLNTSVAGRSSYEDSDIVCGTAYCYQLITSYPTGESLSLEKCGTAISEDIPDPVANITAVVTDPGVTLDWQPVPGFTPEEFTVYRYHNGAGTRIGTATGMQFTDESYLAMDGGCYRLTYTDVCGNLSPLSAETCPIQLTGTLGGDNAINLSWTAYSGWQDGVGSYTVEKYAPEGGLLQSTDVGLALSYTDDSRDLARQTHAFVIRANAVEAGLPQSVSNTVVITRDPNLFYPTGFTPNGDNLNDVFNVFGQYIAGFQMNIFNRWGELLFTTNDLEQGWDGTFKGNPMPEGTYTFVADITDLAGRTFRRSGSVLLLRRQK